MAHHYLEAVKALGSDASGKAVVAKMKELPVNDAYARDGKVREDGRLIKEMYLAQVKTPEESKGEWDLYKIIATVPGEKAFRPVAESECPLLK
jgi:branched-chain amino acid transport system substrate-binding protein